MATGENLVLYRKYRPRDFSQIVGQAHVVRTLKNALRENKIAHAYLFAGPRGSGKTTIARILAKALNCANLSGSDAGDPADKLSVRRSSPPASEGGSAPVEPCNTCSNCLDFNAGRSLDLVEIDAASNRGIDDIRNLRESVRFGPSAGRYKVYLIDEAHMITKDAFNAFLKTLEEPPAHAVFILATTEAHRLLATIISRVQRFDFKRLSATELEARLADLCQKEKTEAEPEALKLIAHEAEGSARDAEGMLGQVLAASPSQVTLGEAEEILGLFSPRKVRELVDLMVAHDSAGAINWLHQATEAGYETGQLLKSLKQYFRKMLWVKISPDLASKVKRDLAEDDYAVLARQARAAPVNFLTGLISELSQVKQKLDHYPLPQMAMEVALVNLLSDQSGADAQARLADIPAPQISNDQFLTPKENKFPTGQVSKQAPIPNQQIFQIRIQDSDVLALIAAKWPEVIEAVRPHNHSLSGILAGVKPAAAAADSLTLATKYSFHRDRLSELNNKKIVEDAIEKTAGRRLKLICILSE